MTKRPKINNAIASIEREITRQIESIEGVIEDFEFLQRIKDGLVKDAKLYGYEVKQ